MTDNDKNITEPSATKQKPTLHMRMVDALSNRIGLKIIFWSFAPIIWLMFGGISNYILTIITVLLTVQIGIASESFVLTILYVNIALSYGLSLYFVIWLWRMYKRHVIENKPG